MLSSRLLITRREQGIVAVQFAMFAFAFFGLAAVVIDMRLVFLAQQRMQVATDVSALEGMRYRDRYGEVDRRQRARETLELVFDDDMNLLNGDALQLGAGPLIYTVGGQAESNALAMIQIDPERVFQPALALNLANFAHGDMVAGAYDTSDTAHDELSNYSRSDFVPSGPGAAAQAADSFLSRIRRTNDLLGLDNVPAVSTAGPTIPFLFGLGSSIHRVPGSAYNPRTDGVTVRAQSIAGARRAVMISGPGGVAGFPRMQEFVLISPGGGPLWDSFGAGGSVVLTRDASGTLRQGGTIWGRYGSPVSNPTDMFHIVGMFVQPGVGTAGGPNFEVKTGETYVPIVRSIGGNERVIGWGRIRVTNLGGSNIRVQKMRGIVEHAGVSAIVPAGVAALASSAALRAAYADFTEPMLGPVLTR